MACFNFVFLALFKRVAHPARACKHTNTQCQSRTSYSKERPAGRISGQQPWQTNTERGGEKNSSTFGGFLSYALRVQYERGMGSHGKGGAKTRDLTTWLQPQPTTTTEKTQQKRHLAWSVQESVGWGDACVVGRRGVQCWHQALTGERACIGKHQIYMCVWHRRLSALCARAVGQRQEGLECPCEEWCRTHGEPLDAHTSSRRLRSTGQPAGRPAAACQRGHF